jgi:hypothetical protein
METRPDIAVKEIFDDNVGIEPGQVELIGNHSPGDDSSQRSSRLDEWFVGV